MRKSVWLVLFLIVGVSCNNDDDNNGESRTYSFFQNAQIDTSEIEGVVYAFPAEGANLVFEYTFVDDDDPNIADDEYSEAIIFEISPELETFEYTDAEILDAKMYFRQFCFCFPEGSIQISKGFLKGSKRDNTTWDIEFDILFTMGEQEMIRKLKNRFSLVEELP